MNQDKISQKTAVVTGCSILVMAVIAAITYGYAHTQLLELSSFEYSTVKPLLTTEIIGWITIALCDLVVSYGVYRYFKNIHFKLAFWSGILRLIYTLFLLVGTGILIKGVFQLDENATLESLGFVHQFETIWSIGLVVFGVHLFLLGLICIKAKTWYWGYFLVFAGWGYTVLNLVKQLNPEAGWLEAVEVSLSAPMAVAEIGFAIWLITVGRKHSPKRPEFHQ